MDSFAQIESDICNNAAFVELSKNANLVMGEGDLNAAIIFVGEAPGKKEDELKRPFVGASGELLNKLLDSIALARSNVYITNIVKYRPPNNRDPKPEEKNAFLPYLERQISLIQPKVIVTLGRHPMSVFLGKVKISVVHGTPQKDSKGRIIVPLYHPASAMYNGSLRQTLFDDFKKLEQYVR